MAYKCNLKDNPTETERLSWTLWYTDSSTCKDDYGYEWFRECAWEGDALCQHLPPALVEGRGHARNQL